VAYPTALLLLLLLLLLLWGLSSRSFSSLAAPWGRFGSRHGRDRRARRLWRRVCLQCFFDIVILFLSRPGDVNAAAAMLHARRVWCSDRLFACLCRRFLVRPMVVSGGKIRMV
jgi:hypothetical protein